MTAGDDHLGGSTRTKRLEFDWDLRFTQTQTRLACEYWTARRAYRAMPAREDLNPGDMRKFSPHVG